MALLYQAKIGNTGAMDVACSIEKTHINLDSCPQMVALNWLSEAR